MQSEKNKQTHQSRPERPLITYRRGIKRNGPDYEKEEEKEKQKAVKAAKPRRSSKRKARELETPAAQEVNSANHDIHP